MVVVATTLVGPLEGPDVVVGWGLRVGEAVLLGRAVAVVGRDVVWVVAVVVTLGNAGVAAGDVTNGVALLVAVAVPVGVVVIAGVLAMTVLVVTGLPVGVVARVVVAVAGRSVADGVPRLGAVWS